MIIGRDKISNVKLRLTVCVCVCVYNDIITARNVYGGRYV